MAKRNSKKAPAKKTASKKPAKNAAKKIAKKGIVKKAAPKKAKRTPAKKAAAPKKALASLTTWEVVCSVDKVIARGLTKEQARQQSKEHQAQTGHSTTFVNGQGG